MNIPFSKVDCSGNELVYLTEVLKSGWLTTAKKTLEFEKKFSEYIGVSFACAVNSGTAALHLGIEALGVKPGDKVFVQTMTFTASAEIIRYMGADPIFLDVEYGSNLITPEILKKAIEKNPGVKTLVIVHYGGQAAEMVSKNGEGILDICKKNGITILEDAAHAFPTRLGNKMVGGFGDITCFSFYANKTITTGEGGMLTTNRQELWERVKVMRLHGINRDIWNRYTEKKPNWEYDVIAPGFKYNLPDTGAAIGLAQLERAEDMRRERERCAAYYFKSLSEIECINLPLIHCRPEDHSWHIFPIILKDSCSINRNEFIEKMAEAGIGCSVHYKPLHRMTYYKEQYGLSPDSFPNAEKIWKGCVSLPIYSLLENSEVEYICKTIKSILRV